jgi:ATP-dependent exoDNAse (exonuclease V) beta subunit
VTLRLNDEQALAARTLEGRLLITAGAGSGKTSVLTQRAANAVVPGSVPEWEPVELDRMLAITFTDKAAGELAERVRGALRSAGRKEDAGRVDGAWITTIHGMCARILRASALEAGIDPSFTILDTVDGARLRQRALEDTLREKLSDHRVARLLSLHSVKTLTPTVYSLGDDLRTRLLEPSMVEIEAARAAGDILAEAVELFSTAMRGADAGASAEAFEGYDSLCRSMTRDLLELGSSEMPEHELAYELWRLLDSMAMPSKWKGLRPVKDAITAGRLSLAKDAAAAVSSPLGEALLELAAAYVERYRALKEAQAGLDYDDLQIEALRLLQDGGAGRAWEGRFDLTMVDEFQDTDRLQLRIVERLGGERLCSVGDAQQSIYRFRGAEVSVYRAHRLRMLQKGAQDVALHTNYRSHADILSFVNHVFGATGVFGEELVELRPDPGREDALRTEEPRVEVITSHKQGNAAGDARRLIACEVADRLAALREKGVSAGDMAVLAARYTHAHRYADALRERGFDVLVVGGSRFFEQPEICALRSFVELVANTANEEAAAAVLASEMCGLSDDGLLALRAEADKTGATLWGAVAGAELGEADRLVADALVRAVGAARRRMGAAPLGEILLRAVEDCGYDALLTCTGAQGGQAYANVLKLARIAEKFEAGGGAGASAFAVYLDDKEAFGDHEAPASLVKDGSEAVRIMSIHAAKGLEFPIVVVPELGERGSGGNSAACWEFAPDRARLAVKLPGGSDTGKGMSARTRMMDEIVAEANEAEDAEEARLLYVACTRAEEALILCGAYAPNSGIPNNLLGLVMRSIGVDAESGEMSDASRAGLPFVRAINVRGDACGPQEEESEGLSERQRVEWLQNVLPREETAAATPIVPPERLSYSSLSRYEECPLRYAVELLAPASSGTGPALAFGSAFHALAQLYGENAQVDDDRVRAIVKFHGLDEDAGARLREALERYRTSPVARRLEGFRVLREAPFALRVGTAEAGFILDGDMDIFAVGPDGALVVDFKTGKRDMSADEIARRYRRQADCYALAALRGGHERVSVVFVRPEVEEEGSAQQVECVRTSEDIARIESELLALHAAMCGRDESARSEYDPDACRGCRVPPSTCGLSRDS